jgi:hypothetical protein
VSVRQYLPPEASKFEIKTFKPCESTTGFCGVLLYIQEKIKF